MCSGTSSPDIPGHHCSTSILKNTFELWHWPRRALRGCYNRRTAYARPDGAHSTLICITWPWYTDLEQRAWIFLIVKQEPRTCICVAGVIDVYMHSKNNPSCIVTLCMRRADMHNRDDFFMHQVTLWDGNKGKIRSGLSVMGNLKLSTWDECLSLKREYQSL